jgi:hypothetical protein
MTILISFATTAVALKGLLACALFVAGFYLLRQAKRARRPATVVNGRIVAQGLHRFEPIVVVQPPPRLKAGAELGRLAEVIQSAKSRIDAITTCQRSASRHLDSAEIALNALLAEIGSVMPPTISPSVHPRRTLAMAA